MALGNAVRAPLLNVIVGPSIRDDFEALTAKARVLRIFAHGTPMLPKAETSHIDTNEDGRRLVNRYTVVEARTPDLRGARPVEMWACESCRGDTLHAYSLHHDEPGGMDATALLARAECVVASLWTHYVLSSYMIAEAFTLELAGRPPPEAAALGSATRQYREGLSAGGVFTPCVRHYVSTRSGPARVESALRAGLDVWRHRVWRDLLGREAPATRDFALDGPRLGPSQVDSRTVTPDGAVVDQILAPYRSSLAWAGWRVTLRRENLFAPASARDP